MTVTLKRKLDDRGFTLLEVAVALFLIATTLLAVFRLQAQNLDLQSEADFITVARQLAQDRLARIQAESGFSEGIETGDFGKDHEGFSYQTEVRELSGKEGLYRVKVSVFQRQEPYIKDYSAETYLHR